MSQTQAQSRMQSQQPQLVLSYLMGIWQIARKLSEQYFPQKPNGGTLNPRSMTLVDFGRNVFSVSLKHFEDEFERTPSVSQIRQWLSKTFHILQQNDKYLGWWKSSENGLFYLDVSIIIDGYTDAMAVAVENKQEAIYEFGTGQTHYTDTKRRIVA